MAGRSGCAAGLGALGAQLAEVLGLASAVQVPALATSSVRGAAQRDVALHAVEGCPGLLALVMQAPTAAALASGGAGPLELLHRVQTIPTRKIVIVAGAGVVPARVTPNRSISFKVVEEQAP